MKFRQLAKVAASIALAACVFGMVFLSSLVRAVIQDIEERNLDAFLSGRSTIYKGYDSAVPPF